MKSSDGLKRGGGKEKKNKFLDAHRIKVNCPVEIFDS